jgi:glycosyltransferase involved in cell wall biosynthesis
MMENSGRVAILLATYNGEKYLDEQIRSIFAQTYSDFVVVVRDDHSDDRTPQILAQWSLAQPDKIRVVSDNRGNLRSLGNFSYLMEVCDAPYFLFCDQDDVWLPNKIELMINEVRRLENQFGRTMPILIHSDLKVVDEDLEEIAPSLFDHLYLNVNRRRQLRYLLFDNIVVGCALVGNRALLELARPIPDGIPYHDWWVALVAASCGVLSTVAEPTVLYRQHDRNQVGAGPRKGRKTLRDARYIAQQPRKLKMTMARIILAIQFRACLLLRLAGHKMPRRKREFLRALSLPRSRDEAALLPWAKRTWLFVRFLILYLRMLPIVLHRCY